MAQEKRLFSEKLLSAFLKKREAEAIRDISECDEIDISSTDLDQLVHTYINKHTILIPVIQESKIILHKEDEYVAYESWWIRKYTYDVPYKGDGNFFTYQPSQYTLKPPSAKIQPGKLLMFAEIYYRLYDDDPPVVLDENDCNDPEIDFEEVIKQRTSGFTQNLANIKQHLKWMEEDIAEFHTSLETVIRRHLIAHRKRLIENQGVDQSRVGTITKRVFIGHGHSELWRDLKDFLQEQFGLLYDEFDREAFAGITSVQRLEAMLENACFAFLVLTEEDEQLDRSRHSRLNVVHELGLFQGRLGFKKAIILIEEGCTELSNIHGLTQIRFPKNNIKAELEEISRVLERENIISTTT